MKIFLAFALSILSFWAYGQKQKTYFPVWTFHQKNIKIYGISAGLWDFANSPRNTTTNGVRLSLIGEGILVPLIPRSPIPESDSAYLTGQSWPVSERINGIGISGTGSLGNYVVNGISIGYVGNIHRTVNGFSAAAFMNFSITHRGIQFGGWNDCYKMRGLQIGILNKSKNTRGIQLGIWNINEKRRLPILNWNFSS